MRKEPRKPTRTLDRGTHAKPQSQGTVRAKSRTASRARPTGPGRPARPNQGRSARPPRARAAEAPAERAPTPRQAAAAAEAAANAPAPELSSKRKSELRARAHSLSPLVQVGHGGLRLPVLDAVRLALRDHELIKVRLHEPEDKRAMAQTLATETRSALCGLVGHTVILYKPRPNPHRG